MLKEEELKCTLQVNIIFRLKFLNLSLISFFLSPSPKSSKNKLGLGDKGN